MGATGAIFGGISLPSTRSGVLLWFSGEAALGLERLEMSLFSISVSFSRADTSLFWGVPGSSEFGL
jgi:hypothetical protein